MHNQIASIIEDARNRFALWLDRYAPWHGNNGITERNLSFQFATAFLTAQEGSLAFMEVPFPATDGGALRNHLDAYFHCNEFDVLLECKVVWAETHSKAVAADIDRLQQSLLHRQIVGNHLKTKPTQMYGVILAETWYPKVVEWWMQTSRDELHWSREGFPGNWRYNAIEVARISEEHDGTLYWLYAISPEMKPTK